LDGSESLKIPAGTQSGEVFRLRGKGMRDLESRQTGDLFVKVLVQTPTDISKEQRNLLRQLAELRGEKLERLDKIDIQKNKNLVH
ncbi:MAG: molecular chaperone DnaJ, partial [Candidatus Aminicenantes bacterium]|nr:molecular chaperone DnaJ [Candidatus Aminicenantes bacterium]